MEISLGREFDRLLALVLRRDTILFFVLRKSSIVDPRKLKVLAVDSLRDRQTTPPMRQVNQREQNGK